MGILARLFGYVGTVRFEFTTADGKVYAGKTTIETVGQSVKEVEASLKNFVYVETGKKVVSLKILAIS